MRLPRWFPRRRVVCRHGWFVRRPGRPVRMDDCDYCTLPDSQETPTTRRTTR